MSGEQIAKSGRLLMIDEGAYSDYGVAGFFVVLRDFIPAEEVKQYLEANPDAQKSYHFNNAQFLAGLLSKGLLLEILYDTLHLTDYGTVAEFRFDLAGKE